MEQAKKATPTWWEVTVEVQKNWAEDAAANLMEAGAQGVETIESSEPLPGYAQTAMLPQRPVARDAKNALLIASFEASHDGGTLALTVTESLRELGLRIDPTSVRVSQRQDRDWAETWKQYFKPIKVARRLWIVPTWEKHFEAPINTVVLHLDPGMAFGTGQHATTALCMRAIELAAEQATSAQKAAANVLDLGTGTGILAMTAAKLGYRNILATDNDPEALDATRANIELNHTPNIRVSGDDVARLDENFDLIVANILAPTLIDMAHTLLRRLQPGGSIVLSGILATQADDVIWAYERAATKAHIPLRHTHRWTHGEWAALRFQG